MALRHAGSRWLPSLILLLYSPGECQGARADGDGAPDQAWIGNRVGIEERDGMQSAVTDLWVDRDGTAYLVAPRELGAPSSSVFRGGRRVDTEVALEGLVIAGNRTHLFVGSHGGVRILPKDPAATGPDGDSRWIRVGGVDGSRGPSAGPSDGIAVRGLHATENSLFLSNASRHRIEQWSLQTFRKIREWPVQAPGALVLDPWSGLWAICGDQSPDGPATIIRLDLADGRVEETLTDVGIPTALAIILRSEENYPALLVADNGPRQQILRFSRKHPERSPPLPALGNRYGMLGQAGPRPSDRRFNGLTGLGVSVDGTLFVAQNWNLFSGRRGDYRPQCAELLAFSREGMARFEAQALYAGDPAAIRPTAPYDVFYRNVRLALEWDRPGLPWRLAGRTRNPLLFPEEGASLSHRSVPVIRTVLGHTVWFEVEEDTLRMYRRDSARYGDAWVPLGAFRPRADPAAAWPSGLGLPALLEARLRRGAEPDLRDARTPDERRKREIALNRQVSLVRSFGWTWSDGRGAEPLDGQLQRDEVESLDGRLDGVVWSVDVQGGVWAWGRETDGRADTAPPRFAAWIPERLDAHGMPVYRRGAPHETPAPFTTGTVCWYRYLPSGNRMLVAGTTAFLAGWGPQVLCVYEAWRNPLRRAAPPLRSGFVLLRDAPGDAGAGLVSLDTAGNWLFTLRMNPPRIQIHDLRLGHRVATFRPPPPPGGFPGGPVGEASLRAALRDDGTVALLLAIRGANRLLAVNWRPSEIPAPAAPPRVERFLGNAFDQKTELCWGTEDAGAIIGYHLYRATEGEDFLRLTETPLASPFYTDRDVRNGQAYDYRASIVHAGGEGPLTDPLQLVPNQPVARFVGEDRRTQGDWRGRYGTLGYHLFGESRGMPDSNNPKEVEGVSGPSVTLGRDPSHPAPIPDVRLDPALPLRTATGTTQQRVAGLLAVADGASVVFPVAIRNGRSLRTSLYCGSSERIHGVRIEMVDPDSGEILDAREFSNETEPHIRGRTLTWDLTGTVLVRLSAPRNAPLPDQCGINALFFDPATSHDGPARTP